MKIGIFYNVVENVQRGFQQDVISDNEIIETVEHVKNSLTSGHEVVPVRIRKELLSCLSPNSFDLVFNLCEGLDGNPEGEVWLPALLDILGIPYTGSDSNTLGLCLNKFRTKRVLEASGIKTPGYQLFSSPNQRLEQRLEFPLIVKPVHEDASVGITAESVVSNKLELLHQLEFIIKSYKQPALVEEYIEGRELNVALIRNSTGIKVFPISEIVFEYPEGIPKIVSYEAKWLKDHPMYNRSTGICPARLSRDLEKKVIAEAIKAFNATGCRDYARVDFRVKDGLPYILEVNPNPSINTDSGFIRSATAAGLDYRRTIHLIIEEAMSRYDLHEGMGPASENDQVYEGARLIAREVRMDHIDLLMKWFNDPQISRFMDGPEMQYSREDLIEKFFVEKHRDLDIIMTDGRSGQNIGYIALNDIDLCNGFAEVSILVGDNSDNGKGYGTEMVSMIIDMAFGRMGLRGLFARVAVPNIKAMGIFERNGFSRIGTRRKSHCVDGERYDEVYLELLKEDLVDR